MQFERILVNELTDFLGLHAYKEPSTEPRDSVPTQGVDIWANVAIKSLCRGLVLLTIGTEIEQNSGFMQSSYP